MDPDLVIVLDKEEHGVLGAYHYSSSPLLFAEQK